MKMFHLQIPCVPKAVAVVLTVLLFKSDMP